MATERVEAILRRYGVAERDIGQACADLAPYMPERTEHVEYGVERSFPQWDDGKPHIEWGGSVGMSHNYPYTEDSVWSLADGNPVYRRIRTRYRDRLSEPERLPRS
jgi:hypothetical protein